MKKFIADDELIFVLKKNNFIETTSKIDILKGKKSFKISRYSKKEIHFDYQNIKIWNSVHEQDNAYSISENNLKFIILYFKLKSNEISELMNCNQFKFKDVEKKYIQIIKELSELERINFKKSRQNKLKRIKNAFENLIL